MIKVSKVANYDSEVASEARHSMRMATDPNIALGACQLHHLDNDQISPPGIRPAHMSQPRG